MNSEERSLLQLSMTCSIGYRSSFSFLLKSFQVICYLPKKFYKLNSSIRKNLTIHYEIGEVFGAGYLEFTSEAATKHIGSNGAAGGEVKLLNALTEPLTKLIVQVVKSIYVG